MRTKGTPSSTSAGRARQSSAPYICASFPPGLALVHALNARVAVRACLELEAHAHLTAALLVLTLLLWVVTRSADPGSVRRGTPAALARVDGLAPRYCQRCACERPARAKHCYVCDRCVQRFDHHCVWLGACVGAGNHRRFLALLAVGTATCMSELALAARCVGLRAERFNGLLLSAAGATSVASGRRVATTDALRFLASAQPDALALLVFAATMTGIVGGYAAWCFRLAALDVTSYELRQLRPRSPTLAKLH